MGIELVSTNCAICSTKNNASVIYRANFDFEAFNPAVFSARRIPDMLHYQIVRCNSCGLVRSDPVVDANVLKSLYGQSSFTYSQDTPNLTRTYGRYLQKTEKYEISKDHLLEIGCGNGFLLEEARLQGFKEVTGVEPSKDAIVQANPAIRSKIVCDILHPGLLPINIFSVICMFQTFDHVSEPNILLEECVKLLQPGGVILCLNHNVEAISSRVLKEKSPIIDIEHTYLYSPKTMKRLFENHGLHVLEVGPAWNIIRLHSLLRLFPMPKGIKQKLLDLVNRTPFNKLSLTLPLGNLYIIAQKSR
jgi:SAM-dependent methyltransferase